MICMLVLEKNDLSKVTFKHIEAEWYKYHHTVKELERLKKNIILSSKYEENIGGTKSNVPGQPTENIAMKLVTHRKIEYLESIIHAIETVYNLINDDYKNVIRMRYWSNRNMTWEQIAEEVGYTKRHCITIRNQVIMATAEVLGWR